MVDKIICAVVSLVAGLFVGIYFLDPVVFGIASGFPCPTDENWAQICLQWKNILLIVPPIISVAGFYAFFHKIGLIH